MPSLRPPTHALGSSPAEASATKPIRPWRQGARSLLRARGCCASELTLPWERKGPCLLVCSGGRRQRASGFSPAQGLPAVGTAVGGRAASAPSSPLSPALIFPAIAPPQKRKLLTLRHLDTSRTSGLGLGQIPGPCLLALSALVHARFPGSRAPSLSESAGSWSGMWCLQCPRPAPGLPLSPGWEAPCPAFHSPPWGPELLLHLPVAQDRG